MVARGRFELPSAGPKPAPIEERGSNNAYFRERAEIKNFKALSLKLEKYCLVDERLEPRVCRDYKNIALRFLKSCKGEISRESVRAYLSTYLNKAPKTYNNQLDGLRAFICRFLKMPWIMEGFKKAHQNSNYDIVLPSKAQIKAGFEALTDDRERAIYLFYATTGLRLSEGLGLNRFQDIDYGLRAVRSKHDTRTKKAGITFYNAECEQYLKRYLESRNDDSERLFRIGYREFQRIWKKASEKAGIKISPQILRKWHSTELGELGVPDRYVDIFQGRAPRTVLAKYYTGKELLRLKRIYEKANLRVLQ
jgi:intergrase/recombinase